MGNTPFSAKMTLKDGYRFGGFSGTPPSEPYLSTPPPPPPPRDIAYIGIFCYWALLHYNMSLKTIAGGFNGAFWWYGPLSEDRELLKQIYQNYLVTLKR